MKTGVSGSATSIILGLYGKSAFSFNIASFYNSTITRPPFYFAVLTGKCLELRTRKTVIPWSTVLLETLIVAQIVKKFLAFLWNPKAHYCVH